MNEEQATQSLADLALVLLEAKEEKRKAAEAETAANKHIAELEQRIYEQMKREEIEKFGAHGYLFFPTIQQNPSVKKELEADFFIYLEEIGEDGIIKRTIHPQTLKSWYKEHEELAETLSEKGFVSVFEVIKIGTRVQK